MNIEQNNNRFIPRACELPTMGSCPDLQYQACVFSCGVGLDQQAVGYPIIYNIHDTVSAVVISCHCGHYYNSQDSHLGKTVDEFPCHHPA